MHKLVLKYKYSFLLNYRIGKPMSYLVLARKYRPQTFGDVVGQPHVTQTLANAISNHRLAHALLFTGPRGTGKTTLARIVAKAVNCEKGPSAQPCNACISCNTIAAGNSIDVIEIDGASNTGVDKVRELRENIRYLPTQGRYRIYIIDEVHMLSTGAFNALLKILEEPPAHAMFLFATTDPNKIPITILSRCQRHDLKRVETPLLHEHLNLICTTEKVTLPDGSLWMIAREADGSVRDALSLLDLVFVSGENKTLEFITDLLGGVEQKTLLEFSENVFNGDLATILAKIETAHIRGIDFQKLYRDLLEHFRNLLIVKVDAKATGLIDLPQTEIELLQQQARDVSAAYLGQIADFLFDQETFMRFSSQPKLALEMVFIRLMQFKPSVSVDTLLERLDTLRNELSGEDDGIEKKKPIANSERKKTAPVSKTSSEVKKETPVTKEKAPEKKTPEENTTAEISKAITKEEQTAKAPAAEKGQFDWHAYLRLLEDEHPMLISFLTKADAEVGACLNDEVEFIIGGTEFGFKQIEKRIQELEKYAARLTGHPMRIRLVSQVITETEKKEKRQKENDLKEEILHHPLIKEATRLFKGEITRLTVLKENDV